MNAIKTGLADYLGQPIGSIPNDLGTVPKILAGIPGARGVGGIVGDIVGPLLGGLGDIATRGLVLGAILVLILLGARRLL